MILTHASTSLYGLGTATRVEKFVAEGAKFVVRLKGRWYERLFK
jgi:hypothetical protein